MMRRIFGINFYRLCTITPTADSLYSIEELQQLVMKYPFCKMPNKIHKASLKYAEDKADQIAGLKAKKDAVAFGVLSFPSRLVLQKCCEVLFPEQNQFIRQLFSKKMSQNQFSQLIFQKHYTGRLKELSQQKINRQYYLKVICYMCEQNSENKQSNQVLEEHFQKILQSDWIQDKTDFVNQAYLLRIYAIKFSQQGKINTFLTFIEQFTGIFCKQNNQSNKKLRAALILLRMTNPSSLPELLQKQCIKVLEHKYEQLDDWELFEVFSCLFQIDLKIGQALIEKMTNHIVLKNSQTVKVPLIIKLMNLRHKKKMSNHKISELIKNQPLKFTSIFFKKNSNKQVFLEVLVKTNPLGHLPEQIKIHFNKFLLEQFREFSHKQTATEFKSILKMYKLSLKFYKNLYDHNIKEISFMIEHSIFTAYESEKDVKFWSLIFLFRSETISPFIQEQTRILVKELHEAYMKQSASRQYILDQIIDLNYQLVRNKIFIRELLEKFGEYQYDQKMLFIEQKLIYLYYLLLKIDKVNLSSKQKIRIFNETVPFLEKSLETRKRFYSSPKNLMMIAHLMYELQTFNQETIGKQQSKKQQMNSNIYIWYRLQKRIVELFMKNKQAITHKDWFLIKKYSKNHQLNHFHNLINQSIDHPENYSTNLQEYTKKMDKKKIRFLKRK